ncbi:tumor protein 63-like isoform X1 [Branchiostoma lanceolatum]|uniref:tumor protein 63-like isoform X1 n=1 Tax=Branchiostoma lanceolatum TaxID=7740 RepID=UPI0034568F7C
MCFSVSQSCSGVRGSFFTLMLAFQRRSQPSIWALTQAVTQPLDYEFSDADTGQNRIDFEVKSYQLKAMDSFELMAGQLSQMPSLPNVSSSFLNALGGPDPDQPSTSTGLTSGLTTYTATPSNVPTTSPGVAPGAPSNCATPSSPYSASSEHNMTPPPVYPVQSPVGQIPSNTDYSGPLGFEFSFGPQQTNTAKSATWTYSEVLNKLYVRMALTCPVKFKTRIPVPHGCFIRAMPLYKKPEHVTEVVKRCHNHTAAKEFNDHPAPSHLIRVEGNPNAQYWEDPHTQRQSVTIMYESPQAGTEYNTVLYNFMCFSSCVGGLNRRPTQVIFTLENGQGQVLGRRVVEVRICACPGRDRKTEERSYNKAHGNQPSESTPVKNKKGVKRMSQGFTITTLGSKKRKTPDDNVYYVPVRGRENYEILMRIKESLELMQMIPKAQVEQYRATQANLSKIPSLHTALNRTESFNNSPLHNDHKQDHTPNSQFDHSGASHSSTDTISPHNGHPPMDTEGTVADWLTKLGCASCIETFHRRRINFVSQLEEINLQDLHEMKLTERLVDKIWKGIIEHKAAKDFSDTPSLLRRSSTASTVDLNGSGGALQPGGVVEATRFTLKQTISLDDIKVKQERVEEEEEWEEEEVEMGFNQQTDHDYV